MSTPTDWPGAQHHPTAPLAGESLQRNWRDGPMEPLNAFGSLASAATNATPGTQADSFGAIGTPFAYRAFQHVRPAQKPGKQCALRRTQSPFIAEGSRFVLISLFLAQIYGCERWRMSQEEPSVP